MADMARRRTMMAMAALAMLSACGGGDGDKAKLEQLDAELTNNALDPALRGAIEDPIASDPDLTGQSNSRAVRPAERPADNAIPIVKGDPKAAQAAALKFVGGKLMSTPAPRQTTETPATLGGLAQKNQPACGAVQYGMQWAERLPPAFPLYPGAQLQEAAGNDGAACALRAVSFTTPVPVQSAVDFYYTLARRGGFSAEHLVAGAEHQLGGTGPREGAYFITFTPVPGGGTAVDLIANNGR